jgi:putative membrane protein
MLKKLTLGMAFIFLVFFVYASVVRPLFQHIISFPLLVDGLIANAFILVLFSLFHSIYYLGWRHSIAFFILSAIVSWLCEEIGVITGCIYGSYHYTDMLGMKLGHVPVLIPLAWFMMIYPSYIIANLIAGDESIKKKSSFFRIVWLSLLSAVVMTAFGLVIDPALSNPKVAAWVWEQDGIYFGIPLQNYAGWLLTTFTIYFFFRLLVYKSPLKPMGKITKGITVMPLVAYGAIIILNFLENGVHLLQVIGFVAMGIPLVIAAIRLGKSK